MHMCRKDRLTQALTQAPCRQAAATGKDSFLMGPSGYGFLHPSLIDAQDPLAAQLVNDTLAAGGLMQAQGFVLWDEYNNKATM